MNYIKRNIFVTLLATFLISLGLNSCKNLDFPNPNDPDLDNPPDIQRLVSGSESEMRNELEIYLRVVETFGRNAYYFEVADPRYTGELLTGPIDEGGFLLNRHWQSCYRVIKTSSVILDAYSNDKQATGFAHTIIGYQLLMLLNFTNDNGIKIVFSEDVNTPFVSKAEAYTEIERRLDLGYADLTSGGTANYALSSGFDDVTLAEFNRAIKARVLVLQGKWAEALTTLDDSFIDETAAMDLGAYHVYTSGAGDQNNSLWEDPLSTGLKLYAHPSFKTDAEAGDTRFSSKVLERPDSLTGSFNSLTSTLAVTIVSDLFDKISIIRNEELLLLRAEANIGLGNNGTAETDINVVRAAAGLAGVDVTSMSAGDALNQLLHEKRYSLFMEGHRWVDMRHYDKLGDLPLDRAGDVVIKEMPKPESEVAGG
ncbi:MAG: RagB/SusD family nutrient uptake outer membrane protein [Calditrichaeota bacterium]|nr:MAG: RagB/SusD family nutrient uptake outer membrane protein [Calditrichota bacterium]MBL1206176.1 RagB/SusD family nutrient uptake outer membrane protein [Calditrichota bacterium]NOG46001.1 RagB/SusD family nutrient uptake outer membrane protein [Calditrichota bacterium]